MRLQNKNQNFLGKARFVPNIYYICNGSENTPSKGR